MRDRLGVIVRAAERLRPLRNEEMALRAPRARNLLVGNVAGERVPERVLPCGSDIGATITPEKLSPLEAAEDALDLRPGPWT